MASLPRRQPSSAPDADASAEGPARLLPDPEAVRLVPRAASRRYRLVPIGFAGARLKLAMRDPSDLEALDYIQLLTKKVPEPIPVTEEEVLDLEERAYGTSSEARTPEELAEEAIRQGDREGQEVADMPVVRLLDLLLTEAVRRRATDIHIQPAEKELEIRFRIDGMLHHPHRLPVDVTPALVARIKILSALDISERRLPQDGKIAVTFGDRPIDLRVSTMRTVHGEAVVLRILDHARVMTSLEDLGFPGPIVERIGALVRKPNGIFLATGPTGSGKTTTLYACLRMMDKETRSILTLEDPVEYRLAGIRQSQIHEKAGFTFASGLRAMLRQDPDVILVGEMRDPETVATAMRAALTGHLVLSTLHTNSAIGAISRLRDMGVEPYLLAASLSAVLAQRLMRRLCGRCSVAVEATEADRRYLGAAGDRPVEIRKASGCDDCNGVGYSGRFAVCELVEIGPEVREGIARGREDDELLRLAREEGGRSLRELAAEAVLQGLTTIDEMVRIVF